MAIKLRKQKQDKKQKQRLTPVVDKQAQKDLNYLLVERLKIAWLVLMGALALFLLLSLFSYNHSDPGWTVASSSTNVQNYAGIVGAYTANFILAILGVFGFLLPFLLVYGIWLFFLEKKSFAESSILLMLVRTLGVLLLLISGSGLASALLSVFDTLMPEGAGGILGQEVAFYTLTYLSTAGGVLVLLVGFVLGLTLFSGGFWARSAFYGLLMLGKYCKQFCQKLFSFKLRSKPSRDKNRNINSIQADVQDMAQTYEEIDTLNFVEPVVHLETEASKNDAQFELPLDNENFDEPSQARVTNEKKNKPDAKLIKKKVKNKTDKKTGLPNLDLLDDPDTKQEQVSSQFLDKMAALVEEKLADFGVKVKVVDRYPGPVITRFEVELAPGVKVSKLTGLAQDLARSLSTTRVRVVEVIPGKPYVGLELPNQTRQMVRLKEVLCHKKFKESSSPLTMGLGVDIAGAPEMANLAKMPHLLVAGTTGSGKSVGVNAMIISMLYKSTPEELRLIMIDPKMLELSIYEGIPHLLTPVVTDMNEAANALRWCVKEMDRRYELMAAAGVRNIAGLNDKIKAAYKAGEPLKDPLWLKLHPGQEEDAPLLEKLPFIVVIADEFADMMMVVGKKVEELIARLAQKARAAGIHLILATQRPSVDVVTGLIKANIPTRIAFQVSSRIDSRTILDQQGAEQLLGHGDMLYLPPGSGVPMRVHGAFVDDDEVHRVVAAWKEMGEPEYIESVTASEPDEGDGSGETGSEDPLYDEAVKIVIETQRASISSIQRRLRIGYNRSARLIEEMEAAGVVSEMQSNGMREVLVKK
ncbi:FtsK/SpoIIIE family DNA translocase [Facilibium subflavum]|uniref:FtsK/SpoIIIE family DNA translocase n=1 Tax=Facilibium subflavum TaxID=2219058 RepID=UPI000E65C5F1